MGGRVMVTFSAGGGAGTAGGQDAGGQGGALPGVRLVTHVDHTCFPA
jgi:hypothetical protein